MWWVHMVTTPAWRSIHRLMAEAASAKGRRGGASGYRVWGVPDPVALINDTPRKNSPIIITNK